MRHPSSVLMDKHCLIVGSQASDEYYQDMSHSIASWLIYSMERIRGFSVEFNGLSGDFNFVNKVKNEEKEDAMIFFKKFKVDNQFDFVLVTLSRNKRTATLTETYLPKLVEQLELLL